MQKIETTLIEKKSLTHDVFELKYQIITEPLSDSPKPGQYIMFQLAPGLNRSYSLSEFYSENNIFTLIIKKIPNGK